MPNATIIAQQLFVVYYKTEWTQHKNHSIIFLTVQLTTPPTVCIHSTNIVLYIETTSTQYILHVGSQTLSHTKKFPICATKTCNTCHYFVNYTSCFSIIHVIFQPFLCNINVVLSVAQNEVFVQQWFCK